MWIQIIKTSVFILILIFGWQLNGQNVKISEEQIEFKTYPFSDPDPVPNVNRIYPYFYFHGYTNNPIQKKWKMVVLENEYIKVFVCPDIGGKVWGAIEKSTGKEFLYYNHVVKFRDVAMRGAWTSGGLEYNFGDIGHIPTCATPVDYTTKENADGSVSCIVGAIDLPSGTKWNVEIKVSPGKAFFETKASWFNTTELPCTYYHWMNAAAKASNDLEFIYPGNNWIGHGEEIGIWPEENNRKINWYKNNDFGSYKSYHVINSYSDLFGGYWHNEDFGFGHYSDFDEKPGKKLWIWGLSQQGMIWKDLLTDNDPQYIEFQAGKLFNQAANSSSKTPFKHKDFSPHDADIMKEIWFPLKGTGGMVAVSEFAVLNVDEKDEKYSISLSALQSINADLQIYRKNELIHSAAINLNPLELFQTSISKEGNENIKIVLGDGKLIYSTEQKNMPIERPNLPNKNFDWESAYGQFTKGLELEKQRDYIGAKKAYKKAIEKDAGFLPALNRLAQLYYRQMDYSRAFDLIQKSLAIDTYDGEANYLLGLICLQTGDITTSKNGFSIAMGTVSFKSSAATELAGIFLQEQDYVKADRYSKKALAFNSYNLEALQIRAIANRKRGNLEEASIFLKRIGQLDATNIFQKFETYQLSSKTSDKKQFIAGISNELPHESYLDLAVNYYQKGCLKEASEVLELAPKNPIINLWLAHLKPKEKDRYYSALIKQSTELVFPHRIETAQLLHAYMQENTHWKLKYYLGLILWNKGKIGKAKELFSSCGNQPDVSEFYLAKARLFDLKKDQFDWIKKAFVLDPNNWRAALALAKHYLSEKQPTKAKEIIQPLLELYPEQSALGLCYAQCLSEEKQYLKAIKFLEEYEILPFEGATIGRDLYNEICIRSATEALKNGQMDNSIKLANKAKLWPTNLGVGRPYDVDERLEDCILYLAYKAKGDINMEKKYADNIMEYKHPRHTEENSKLYLQLVIFQRYEKKNQGDNLLSQFIKEYPESNYLKWVKAKYDNSAEARIIEQNILGNSGSGMAYDTKFEDKRFSLLLEIVNELR
jgi:Tfp pilus assembly protein PilF